MATRIWDDVITPADRKQLERISRQVRPRERWGQKPALLIIDMEVGFIRDGDPEGYPTRGMACIRNCARLLDAARKAGIPIMWTGDAACGKKIAERGHWKTVYPNAPNIWDPKWHEIAPELAIDPEAPMEHMAFKAKPSGFHCSQLPDLLNYYRCDTVIVTGMVTSGCVRATVVDAFSYNFITIVPEECVADRVEISHKVSLFDMHMKYADVVSLNEVIQYIQETSPKGW